VAKKINVAEMFSNNKTAFNEVLKTFLIIKRNKNHFEIFFYFIIFCEVSGQRPKILMLQKCYSNNKTASNEVLKTIVIIIRIYKKKKSL
jgi:hypothetical protein